MPGTSPGMTAAEARRTRNMMNVAERKQTNAPAEAQRWLASFESALRANDAAAAAELFHTDGLWRDVLAFTWTIRTMAGRAAIAAALRETLARARRHEIFMSRQNERRRAGSPVPAPRRSKHCSHSKPRSAAAPALSAHARFLRPTRLDSRHDAGRTPRTRRSVQSQARARQHARFRRRKLE